MLGLPHDRRAGVARRCCDRALRESGTRYVQRHHRRRRVLDQRLAVRAGVRRQRRRRSTTSSIRRCSKRFLAVSRELALGIVRGGEGATKLISVHVRDARSDRRRAAGRADDRQLAAGQDRGARRRPELGPHRRRGRTRRASTFDVQRATVHVGGILLFENGLPHDDAAPQAAEHLKGKDDPDRRQPGHRRTASSDDLDLRPERRVRAHQRRVPNVNGQRPRRRASAKDFLSILDLSSADLDRLLRVCGADEGRPAARTPGADGDGARRPARRAAVREAVAAHALDVRDRRSASSAATRCTCPRSSPKARASRSRTSRATSSAGSAPW